MLRFFVVSAPRLDPAHAASEAVFSGMTLAEFAARFALHLTPRRALRAARERAFPRTALFAALEKSS